MWTGYPEVRAHLLDRPESVAKLFHQVLFDVDVPGRVRRVVERSGGSGVVRLLSGERVSLRAADRHTAVARTKEIVRHLGGDQVAIREKGSE